MNSDVFTIHGSTLTSIASAIRSKAGTSSAFTPAQMIDAINNIPTGGGCDDGNYIDYCQYAGVNFNFQPFIDDTIDTVRDYAFIGCNNLPYTSMNRCKRIGLGAFSGYGWGNLSSFNFPNCKRIEAFGFCNNTFTSISFPECVYIGDSAFSSCANLLSADLPKCEYIGSFAFMNNHVLSSINIPKCKYIMRGAFYMCPSLKTISLPECTYISGGFKNCRLSSIYLPECTFLGAAAFESCGFLSIAEAPKCSILRSSAFGHCPELYKASFPNCLSLGAYCFEICLTLTEISIPKCEYIGVLAFDACSNLSTITLEKCQTIAGGAFSRCVNLVSVYLLNSIMCSLLSSTAFKSTPIASGSGKVYIPLSLYNSYYNDSVWSWFRNALTSY